MDQILVIRSRILCFENIVYQDNKSAILLENSGKATNITHTKHINIRYYFKTDSIEKLTLPIMVSHSIHDWRFHHNNNSRCSVEENLGSVDRIH